MYIGDLFSLIHIIHRRSKFWQGIWWEFSTSRGILREKLLLAAPFTQQADGTSQKWEASGQEKGGSGKHYSKAKV
jgi:hypothetical protein